MTKAGPAPPRLRAAPLSSGAASAVRRQRMFRADLRDRLVPVAAIGHRFHRCLAGRTAGDLYGRPVHRQRSFAARLMPIRDILCGCTLAWNWGSRSAESWPDRHAFGQRSLRRSGGIWLAIDSAARRHCAVCLLPPTMLMGASLPTAARWLETSPEGVSWMGLLYGSNTAGAVFGCLLAGFYLLRDST